MPSRLAMVLSACVAVLALFLYQQPITLTAAFEQVPFLSDGGRSDALRNSSHSICQPPNSSLFYHLGGNSPWIPKLRGTTGDSLDPPTGCRVEQVHMLSRHAERYPTVKAGIRMLELYQRLQHTDMPLNGSLAFIKNWDFFAPEPSAQFEHLVSTAKYSGTLQAFATGVKLRTRYKRLHNEAVKARQTNFWTSSSRRVIDTARYFAAGFYGLEWEQLATLHVIHEAPERGGDTLTPGDTCLDYANNVNEHGHDYGARMLSEWKQAYISPIISRLAKENPGLPFTVNEVYVMQEMCGFETVAKGSSKWCDVFTDAEWESFEYARDLLHYYRAGPGNPYGPTMGLLWLKATAELLEMGIAAGPLFFSFVHDGDLVPLLAALDLFPQRPDLPSTKIRRDRAWRTSDVVPMGGRIIFERLVCLTAEQCWDNGPLYPNHVYCEQGGEKVFVRINVNDGIVAIPGCDDGPGHSCSLEKFLQRVKARSEEVGDFRKTCGLSDDAPGEVTFLHQRPDI